MAAYIESIGCSLRHLLVHSPVNVIDCVTELCRNVWHTLGLRSCNASTSFEAVNVETHSQHIAQLYMYQIFVMDLYCVLNSNTWILVTAGYTEVFRCSLDHICVIDN